MRISRVFSLTLAAVLTFGVSTTMALTADLGVAKTGPATALRGSDVSYDVSVVNAGPDDAMTVSLTDPIPPGMTFVSVSQNNGPAFDCSSVPAVGTNGTITCAIATLTAGSSADFTFVVNIPLATPLGTSFTNTATVSLGMPTDPDDENNTASTSTTVPVPQSDLGVTKTGPAGATAGSDITYSITVTSGGPATATLVSLNDPLSGETFVSFTQNSGPAFSCTTPLVGSGGTINCSIGSLAVGLTSTFTLVANVPIGTASGTLITNTATVSAAEDNNPENDSSDVVTTIASADLSVTKTGPATATAGSPISWIITASNGGPSIAQNVQLHDPLPVGTSFVSFTQNSGPAGTCFAPTPGTNGPFDCNWPTLASGATAAFTINALVSSGDGAGPLINTATISSDTGDPSAGNNTATAITTVSTQAELSISKIGPATVTPGLNATYTISVANAGPSDASATITDVLPPNATFVSVSQMSGPAVNCTPPAVGTTGTITCTVLLVSGASATLTVVVNVNSSANSPVVNTASISSAVADPNNADNSSTTTASVTPSADLAVTKTGPASATAGQNATYTIVVTNNGPSDAQGVSLSDVLPANSTFVSEMQTAGPALNCTPPAVGTTGTITCTVPTLINGGSATLSVVVLVNGSATGTLSNTATLSTTTPDPNNANNSATASAPIVTSADLAVTKIGAVSITAGQNATFTITVTNNGPSDAQTVSLSDPIPANTTFVSEMQNSGPAFTCTPPPVGGTGTLTCSIGTLTAASSASFTLVVGTLITASGTISNTATVASATADPNAANNSATATTSIGVPVADLSLTKTASAGLVIPGTSVTYTINVTNNGPATAIGVTVTDVLPATMTFVSATPSQGSCTGTTTVTCNAGTILNGAGATITIIATSSTTLGPTANTATVTTGSNDPNPANNSGTANVDIVQDIPALSQALLLLLAMVLAAAAIFVMRGR